MSINKFYNFMQVISNIGKHPTMIFSMHILFTRIYLMQEQKSHPRNYCE
jgi:hypothetical protein